MAETQEFLSTAEVARILGVSVATVNRRAADGILPVAHKLPTRVGANLFRRKDIDRVAAETRNTSVAS